jgi:hypothetical protein
MPEPGSKEEYRAVQAELMRAKTKFIRAQTELAKAKTLKVKAETLERHGISVDTDEDDEGSSSEDDEIRALVRRNERAYAQIEREQAKLEKLETGKPVGRLVRRRREVRG